MIFKVSALHLFGVLAQSRDNLGVNRVLVEIDQLTKSEDVSVTLQFCSAFRRRNYVQLFICYQSLSKLSRHLVDLFLDIYRKQVLQVLIWGFVNIAVRKTKTTLSLHG